MNGVDFKTFPHCTFRLLVLHFCLGFCVFAEGASDVPTSAAGGKIAAAITRLSGPTSKGKKM